jgi:DNA-binding NtrC family response regulator
VLVAALEAVGDEVDTLADPGACDTHAELDRFDVVILDAGGGGLEALGRIRRRGVEVPVLVASGDRVERPGDPFTRCAMKPIPLETLDRELASLAALRARD